MQTILEIDALNHRFGDHVVLTNIDLGASAGERIAILGYHEDGPNLVTVAMNGWMEGDPAWWINLQAQPDATVELKGRTIKVHARAAEGDERERLWRLFPDAQPFVAHRRTATAIVVLEPRSDAV